MATVSSLSKAEISELTPDKIKQYHLHLQSGWVDGIWPNDRIMRPDEIVSLKDEFSKSNPYFAELSVHMNVG